jgi:C-terminal peptidase prc
MNRTAFRIVSLASLVAAISGAAPVVADEPKKPAPRAIPAEVVRQARDVVDAVLRSHYDPPTRQEMILSGIKGLYKANAAPVPAGLARQVSDADDDQLATLLDPAWQRGKPVEALRAALLEGLLKPVAGDSRLMTDKEYKVEEQIGGNRYEGVHIALGSEGEERRPTIAAVIAGGPADRAGVKVKDVIEAIDGVDTRGRDLSRVVDRIRGPLGSAVEFRVRQPNSQEVRTLKMTREQLFRPTIMGLTKKPSGEWNHRIDGLDSIAYLRIEQINASTPHELRQIAEQLEGDPPRGVILDLRGLSECDFHSTVLLADSLLASGAIGRLQAAGRTTTFEADPDEIFRGRPIAVVIDEATWGVSEWLTAALQDNARAVVVGSQRVSRPGLRRSRLGVEPVHDPIAAAREFVYETVPVGDGATWLRLVVGRIERSKRQDRPELDALAIKPDRRVALPGTSDGPAGWRLGLHSMMSDSVTSVDPVKDIYVATAVMVLRDEMKKPDSPDRPRESK